MYIICSMNTTVAVTTMYHFSIKISLISNTITKYAARAFITVYDLKRSIELIYRYPDILLSGSLSDIRLQHTKI